ncbi:hypothetical protein PFISCL1PPCAC_1755, partial [Pristionchus fissidentatus]
AMHKKFTFDDPEDSYWNENGLKSNNFFDDVGSKQVAARAAMANLFDADSPFAAGRGPPKGLHGKPPMVGQDRGGRGDGPASISRHSPETVASTSGRTEPLNNSSRRLSIDQQMTPTIMKVAVEEIGSSSVADDIVTTTTSMQLGGGGMMG